MKNSDGPDLWRSWTPENQPLVRNKKQQGGPSIQIWGMLLPGPIVSVFELTPRGDSKDYIEFIETQALPVVRSVFDDNFLLQQDNAPTHSSESARNRFRELGVRVLDWPARSPDLNLIENVWSILSSIVYDGRQFSSKEELWNAIDSAVSKINTDHRESLIRICHPIERRVIQVIERGGGKTDY